MLLELAIIGTSIAVATKLLKLGSKANVFNQLMVTVSAVNNWKFKKTKGFSFDVKLRLFNSTKETVTINWIYLDACLETAYFTNINYNKEIIIEPEKENILIIPVTVKWLDLGLLINTTLGKLLKEGSKPENLIFNGKVKTEGYVLPVNKISVKVV